MALKMSDDSHRTEKCKLYWYCTTVLGRPRGVLERRVEGAPRALPRQTLSDSKQRLMHFRQIMPIRTNANQEVQTKQRPSEVCGRCSRCLVLPGTRASRKCSLESAEHLRSGFPYDFRVVHGDAHTQKLQKALTQRGRTARLARQCLGRLWWLWWWW